MQSAREILGLSITGLAAKMGVQERQVYRWLAGTTGIPPMADRLVALMLKDRNRELSAKVDDR